ncbi:MAG: hypothetical protein RL765_923 [Pseudomonadota bacterium]
MINLLDLDNFIFIPNKNEHDNGLIYELEKTDSFAENTFVILPYQNPQTNQVSPIFFKIISEKKLHKNDLIFDKSINPPIHLKSSISKEAYLDKVVKLKEHIQLGNIYEINYCIQFLSEQINISPLNIFFKLNELTKAPYTALVKLNNDFIISASPELFLKKVGNKLSSKPIKGTIKRGITKHEDDELKNYLKSSVITSFLIGPGAGVNLTTIENTKLICKLIKNVVIDADALTCFAKNPKQLFSILDEDKIITPHEGEFDIIFPELKNIKSKIEKTLKAAKKANCIVVFKGPDTVIASPDGRICINTIGTEELAVIGSGDVLSGIIVSLIGKNKMSSFDGACAGVWIHSYAGGLVKKGLIAEDIIKNLPRALDKLSKKYS